MGAARNGRKNEREGQHREFHKCEVHIDSRTCWEERMNLGDTVLPLIGTKTSLRVLCVWDGGDAVWH